MTEFLHEQSELLQQNQLNLVRKALELVFAVELPKFISERLTLLKSRNYLPHEIASICRRQTDRNAISTVLCAVAGLRGMELLTIRRSDEMSRSTHREWRRDLFAGLGDYVIYIVTGKGGLVREVAIPTNLAALLEARRLPFPRRVRDRGINYEQHYDIGGGQAFGQSFSDASTNALGFSHGAHGLRHSYAQTRLRLLRQIGVAILDALAIVSQELGHFRPEITLVYLR